MSQEAMSVFLTNLGRYNEGDLVGGWLDLPCDAEKIDRFLKDVVKIGVEDRWGHVYEESFISDYSVHGGLADLLPAIAEEHRSLEWENVYALNALAACYEIAKGKADGEALKLAVSLEPTSMDIDEMCNLLLQADDIPYSSYTSIGFTTPEECMGATFMEDLQTVEGLDLGIKLDDNLAELGCYIDYEAIGRDLSFNGYALGDEGYIPPQGALPDLDAMTHEEILDTLESEGYSVRSSEQQEELEQDIEDEER